MKVKSTKTIDFPSFQWGIAAGSEKDLPESKEAQDAILAHPAIEKVGGSSSPSTSSTSTKKKEDEDKSEDKKED